MKKKLKIALVVIITMTTFSLVWYVNRQSNKQFSVSTTSNKAGQEVPAEVISDKNETTGTNTGTKVKNNNTSQEIYSLPLSIVSLSDIEWKTTDKNLSFSEVDPADNCSDVDLHAVTQDGKKVGMNYDTDEYEIQIPGVITSYNLPGGGPEWISIPDGFKASYYIDITPLRKWAKEANTTISEVKASWYIVRDDENGDRTKSKKSVILIDPRKNITPIIIATDIKMYPE